MVQSFPAAGGMRYGPSYSWKRHKTTAVRGGIQQVKRARELSQSIWHQSDDHRQMETAVIGLGGGR